MTKVRILGVGNLAWTLAGDLLLRHQQHYEVTVQAPPAHRTNFDQVAAMGVLKLTGPTNSEFFPVLERDIGRAIDSADFIVVTVPTLGHVDILNILAEYDLRKSILIALPGCGFTLLAKRHLRSQLSPNLILETTSSPYASRRIGNVVTILGVKSQVEIAASKEVDARCKAAMSLLFPGHLEWYQDLAAIFFSNANPIAHLAGILHVKEAILSGVRLLPPFYETFVAAAIDVVLAVDDKRLAIIEALGLQSDTDLGFSNRWYGTDAADSKTFYQTYVGYSKIETPGTIDHRYLKEDVKYIMVLWVEIASVCGIKVLVMESIVDQASAVLNEDLRQTGRTLSSLGLLGADDRHILRALNGIDA